MVPVYLSEPIICFPGRSWAEHDDCAVPRYDSAAHSQIPHPWQPSPRTGVQLGVRVGGRGGQWESHAQFAFQKQWNGQPFARKKVCAPLREAAQAAPNGLQVNKFP